MANINQRKIAERLNVSVATVSKALRESTDISVGMRERVNELANELGYKRPSRQLVFDDKDHLFIGVVRRSYQANTFFAHDSVLKDVRPVADKLNTSLVAQEVLFKDDEMKFFSPEHQTPAMREGLLAGYLIVGQWSADFIHRIASMAPTVVLPYSCNASDIDQVGIDSTGAMFELLSGLYQLGHRRIAFVGRTPSLNWANERFAGYVAAMSQLGLPYRESDVFDTDQQPMLEEGHDEYWHKLVSKVKQVIGDGVTALVCSSDWPANQLHRRLADYGIEVPRDVSLVGFDDSEIVDLNMPPVTSVRVPRQQVAKMAMQRLVELIRNPNQQKAKTLLPCEIIDHATTAPVRH